MYIKLGMRKPVLSICKTWPNFESVKRNNFLSVIRMVSKLAPHMQKSMSNPIKLAIMWTCVFCIDKTCFLRPSLALTFVKAYSIREFIFRITLWISTCVCLYVFLVKYLSKPCHVSKLVGAISDLWCIQLLYWVAMYLAVLLYNLLAFDLTGIVQQMFRKASALSSTLGYGTALRNTVYMEVY